MALDVSALQADKGKMILWPRKDSTKNINQRFKIRQGTGNFSNQYQIFSCVGQGVTVEIPNSSKENGAQIYASSANNSANEFW